MPLDAISAEVQSGSLRLVYVLCLEVVRIQILSRSSLSVEKFLILDTINILIFFFCEGFFFMCGRMFSNCSS